MRAELKAKWVQALTSGKYPQGRDGLRSPAGGYCCLGVLCDVVDPSGWTGPSEFTFRGDSRQMFLPDALAEHLGIKFETQGDLSFANDEEGRSFAEIADWIEQNIPAEAA